jgi:hypothetical protein
MAHCTICPRELNVPDDPDSRDCGGDCYGCIRPLEDGDYLYVTHIHCPDCGAHGPHRFTGDYNYVKIRDTTIQVSLTRCQHDHVFPVAELLPSYDQWNRSKS